LRKKGLTIMGTLMFCFAIAITGIIFSSTATQRQYESFYNRFYQSYSQLAKLVEINDSLTEMCVLLSTMPDVLPDGMQELELTYQTEYNNTMQTIENLKAELSGRSYYYLYDIKNMFLTFDEEVQLFFGLSSQLRETDVYLRSSLREINKLKQYIENEINLAINLLVKQSQELYEQFDMQKRIIKGNTILITAAIACFCFLFGLFSPRGISRPIDKLVSRMEDFSVSGEYNEISESKHVNREINTLIKSYNMMMRQIEEKLEIEQELSRQQVDNLKMKTLVRASELNMLQMQMNPHFLFNTLNSIHALAQIEDAPRTGEVIENLATMLRYSLRGVNNFATLEEEIRIVNSYIFIQKIRFGSRIEFNTDIDPNTLNYSIPSMLIQPLIENAIVHGHAEKQLKGNIWLKVHEEEQDIIISVKDDGCGIEEDKIREIEGRVTFGAEIDDINNSIGLVNVIKRMNLIYGSGKFVLKSQINIGTEIILRIPKNSHMESISNNV
jgi:two-component system sensor histidine kinase YesM